MRFASLPSLFAATLAICSFSAAARADDCPPGEWFCEPTGGEPAPPALPPPPPVEDGAAEPPEPPRPQSEEAERPRRRHRMVLGSPEWEPPPPRRRRFAQPHWALGMHAFGALLGSEAHRDAGFGGVGATLRYRPVPAFALEASGELGFGTDYNGFERREQNLLFHAVGFLNPRSRAQVYLFGGFGFGSAQVQTSEFGGSLHPFFSERDYGYIGLDAGIGLELRVLRSVALHVDLLGFVRDRVSASRGAGPEFVDPETGETTDSSGGGLLRAGVLFYW